MATTYSYVQNENGNDDVRLEYNITPAPGTEVKIGDTITITGRVRWNTGKITYVNCYISKQIDSSHGVSFTDKEIKKSIDKGKWGTFTMTFTFGTHNTGYLTARVEELDIEFSTGNSSSGIGLAPTTDDQHLYWLAWHIDPVIPPSGVLFQRCNASGELQDSGSKILCNNLKLMLNSRTGQSASYVTRATISVTESGKSSPMLTINMTSSQISSMLNGGYKESTPILLSRATINPGIAYWIDVTVGDAFDQTTQRFNLDLPSIIVCYSLKDKGGFAVGMYSNATNDLPMFEVAPNHETHFYSEAEIDSRTGKMIKGTEIVGVNSYKSGEHLTGGYWIDNKPIYRYVWTGSTTGDGNRVLTTLSFNVDSLISIGGSMNCVGLNTIYGVPNVSRGGDTYNSAFYLKPLDAGGMELHATMGSSITGTVNLVVVMEYTKA